MQRVSGRQVQQAGLVSGRIPLNPSSGSRRFSDRTVANVPRPSANTQFFSRSAGQGIGTQPGSRPAVSAPAQAGYHRFGEPGGTGAAQNTRPPQAAGGNQIQRPGNVQRFGEPGSSQSTPRNDRPATSQGGNSNWRSFGNPGSSVPAARQPYNPPQSQPANSAPAPQRSAPSGSAPRSAPAPASHPSGGGHASGGGKGHR